MTFSKMLSTMSAGMLRTCGLFALTLILSLPLGMLVALLRKSRLKSVQLLTRGFISIMRGTPLMLQLLAWYFGPYYLFGWSIRGWRQLLVVYFGPGLFIRWLVLQGYDVSFKWNRFAAAIVALSINYAAYFAEIYRGGIESIPVGQYEAAEVLGYTKTQTFMRIILPQVIKRIMPSVTNEVITLVKDTSLAFTLAYQISASQTSFMPFVIAGVFYFVANYAVEFGMGRIEKALDYYK